VTVTIRAMTSASSTSDGTTRASAMTTRASGTAIATHATRSSKGSTGLEREIVLDERDRTYELDREDIAARSRPSAHSELSLRAACAIRATTGIDIWAIRA
jgi:hypothetical protein